MDIPEDRLTHPGRMGAPRGKPADHSGGQAGVLPAIFKAGNALAERFTDQYLVKHEFIKRLHERYRAEGIIIPYPIRTLIHETKTLAENSAGRQNRQ